MYTSSRSVSSMKPAVQRVFTASSRTSHIFSRQRLREACSNKRLIHTRRALEYPTEDGVGRFLTPQGLRTILDWQDGLLARLNETSKGKNYAKNSIIQTVSITAGREEDIQAFSYASLALNNSFFLDNLKPPQTGTSDNEKRIGQALGAAITSEFGSLADLKLRIVATAKGMMSSGWVWLVSSEERGLAVLPTFGAGTLLVRSRNSPNTDQHTVVEQIISGSSASRGATQTGNAPSMPSQPSVTSPASGVKSVPPLLNPHTPVRSFHSSLAPMVPRPIGYSTANIDPGDERSNYYNLVSSELYPLFCVSVHEHAWLSSGYGVWGKEEYMQNFFSAVHWEKVSQTFDRFSSKSRLLS